MNDWAGVTLGDVAEFINGGAWGADEYADHGLRVVRVTDIKDGIIDMGDCRHLPLESLTKYKKHQLRLGDLIVCTVGSHPTQPNSVVGRVAVVRENAAGALLNQNAVCIRADSQTTEPAWLGYLGRSQDVKDYILSCARGSANQVRMAIGLLQKCPVRLPPLPIQRRIASILSAYDDLIENNQRRIKILEEMARLLYREWFVNFRFPGHEKVRMVDSPLGKIPEGWEVKKVGDSFEISGGGTPSREEPIYWEDGHIQWYSPRDLTAEDSMFIEDSADHITELGLQKSSARKFPAFSVMLTSRATIGAVSINTHEACTNQGFITCLPNPRVPLYLLYHWVVENVPTFERMASGATFKEISRGVFKTIDFIAPDQELTVMFEERVASMANLVLTLQRTNKNLRRTRDLLLPRLLSGQLEVEAEE